MIVRRLRGSEARIIADALYAMARADGVIDKRESEVIAGFLAECAATVAPSLPPSIEPQLRRATEGLRDAFLTACIMLAFADGDFTAEEAVLLRRYAEELEVSPEDLDTLISVVESEQQLPPGPPPMAALLEVLSGWSRDQLPALREKVERFVTRR